jgi:hypothetical protein
MHVGHKPFEDDDPLELVGIGYPVDAPAEADRATARALIEEYALGGWSAEEIRGLFTSPAYAAPFGIARRNGAAFVDELIVAVFGGRD